MQKYRLLADIAVQSREDARPNATAADLLLQLKKRYPRLAAIEPKG